jgi:hypothetical protein
LMKSLKNWLLVLSVLSCFVCRSYYVGIFFHCSEGRCACMAEKSCACIGSKEDDSCFG